MDLLERIEQLEQQVRELSSNTERATVDDWRRVKAEREAAINHGMRWDKADENKLFWHLANFITDQSATFGRTRQGIRIKLLRIIKNSYPDDWTIAHRS